MAILKLLLLGVLPACYAPDLRDCTVSCAGPSECGGGQVCTSEHYCAATGVSCGPAVVPPVDASSSIDAPEIDAPPPPPPPPPIDAPPASGGLHVMVMDKGSVTVAGIGVCDHDCTYTVLLGGQLELTAQPAADHRFEHWMGACTGDDETCTLVPTLPLTQVSAKFRKGM